MYFKGDNQTAHTSPILENVHVLTCHAFYLSSMSDLSCTCISSSPGSYVVAEYAEQSHSSREFSAWSIPPLFSQPSVQEIAAAAAACNQLMD